MNSTNSQPDDEQMQGGLFGEAEAAKALSMPGETLTGGEARLLYADRFQVELRSFDLDASLPPNHPARTVWAFVQSMDLKPLYAAIKSRKGGRGAPAIDPAILTSLWLWATIDGIGSAREVDRLCERDDVYRWLCGGVSVNYHSLADFRTGHAQWLDAQLTRSIASLLDRRLVELNVVSQDGIRVRASAKAASFRRREKLQHLHKLAQEQVAALKRELTEDAGASARRKQAAVERAARDREERLAKAIATMDELAAMPPPRQPKPSKRRGKKQDDPPDGGSTTAVEPAVEPAVERELRVSATDPEARVMKMADGGYRPAFNAQLAVDVETQLIASVDLVESGSDKRQMAPMHASVQQRYGVTPDHWLADGGFTTLEAIEQVMARGTQPVLPPPKSRNPQINPLAPKSKDSDALAVWRATMASEWGKALYVWRGASVECVNAHLRRRGLTQFNVRGKVKAKAVLLWHALAHNLMRMRSLSIAITA
jgi:transposase